MGFKITNIDGLNSRIQMNLNDKQMTSSLEKLGSGLRITKASNDSSGLAIADNLRIQQNTIYKSIKNGNDAIGIIQIADKAIDEQIKILDKIKQKTVQSAADSQTKETREAIQKEVKALLQSLDEIAKTTSYNDMSLLDGSFSNKSFEIGSNSNQTVGVNIRSTNVNKIGHTSFKKSTTTIAKNPDNPFGDVDMKIKGKNGKWIEIPKTKIGYRSGEGIGTLAKQINLASSRTGIKATYDVTY